MERKGYDKYLDEYGEQTFYVSNSSGNVICVSDLGVDINPGAVEDLRKYAESEVLRKSPGLRQALDPESSLLVRLTKSEYDELKRQKNQQAAELQAVRAGVVNTPVADEQGNINEPKVDISPKVQSMVEKLKLFYRATTREKGTPPDQFLLWLQTYTPTQDEKEFMLQTIGDRNIRESLYNKLAKGEVRSDEVTIEGQKADQVKQESENRVAGSEQVKTVGPANIQRTLKNVSKTTIPTVGGFPDRYGVLKGDIDVDGGQNSQKPIAP